VAIADGRALGPAEPRRRAGPVAAVIAAWLVSLAFDLFLHGGLLARLYSRPSDFLLPAGSAFRRIPIGYASFLILTAALFWLLGRLRVASWLAGLRTGLVAGLILWGAWVMGLYSISVAEGDLLIGWWVGQATELALAGAVLGAAASGLAARSLWAKVGVAVVVLVGATLALQLAGWAPPMALASGP